MTDRTIPVRVLLVDDHALFRTSLARLLAAEDGLNVVGECAGTGEAVEFLRSTEVDVILLDFDIGVRRGDALMAAALAQGYQGYFLTITGTDDIESYALALKLGASGVFRKSEPPDRLVKAILLVADGAVWIDQTIVRRFAESFVHEMPVPRASAASLAEREEEVLEGVIDGLTNRRIGLSMGLSESAVKNILQGLFGKTGVRTRSQLVRMALEGSLGRIPSLASRQSGG